MPGLERDHRVVSRAARLTWDHLRDVAFSSPARPAFSDRTWCLDSSTAAPRSRASTSRTRGGWALTRAGGSRRDRAGGRRRTLADARPRRGARAISTRSFISPRSASSGDVAGPARARDRQTSTERSRCCWRRNGSAARLIYCGSCFEYGSGERWSGGRAARTDDRIRRGEGGRLADRQGVRAPNGARGRLAAGRSQCTVRWNRQVGSCRQSLGSARRRPIDLTPGDQAARLRLRRGRSGRVYRRRDHGRRGRGYVQRVHRHAP